jgi:predicted Fe-S protein YdhL (DUF1289 family)
LKPVYPGAVRDADDDGFTYLPPAVPSPCINVCGLELVHGWCLGCGRTGDEIERWYLMPYAERLELVAALLARLATLERETAPPR